MDQVFLALYGSLAVALVVGSVAHRHGFPMRDDDAEAVLPPVRADPYLVAFPHEGARLALLGVGGFCWPVARRLLPTVSDGQVPPDDGFWFVPSLGQDITFRFSGVPGPASRSC